MADEKTEAKVSEAQSDLMIEALTGVMIEVARLRDELASVKLERPSLERAQAERDEKHQKHVEFLEAFDLRGEAANRERAALLDERDEVRLELVRREVEAVESIAETLREMRTHQLQMAGMAPR